MNIVEKYGKWALILGASEGMGAALARKLASYGANVILIGRREQLNLDLAESIRKDYGVEAIYIKQDLAEFDAIEKIHEQTKDLEIGFVTYVACLSSFGRFELIPEEVVLKQINTNIISLTKATHLYYSIFRQRGRGAILNIASAAGINGVPALTTYGATKAYITQLTKTLAGECLDTGIDVRVSIHGSILTPGFINSLPAGPAGEYAKMSAMTPEDSVDEIFDRWDEREFLIIGESVRNDCEPFIPVPSKEAIKATMQMYDRPASVNN